MLNMLALSAQLRRRLALGPVVALAAALCLVASARAQQSLLVPEPAPAPRAALPAANADVVPDVIRPLPPLFTAPAVAGLPLWASPHEIDPAAVELMDQAGDVLELELPGGPGTVVVARLRRVDVIAPDATLILQGPGDEQSPLTPSVSLWTGQVVGSPDSEVFLGISTSQAQGWITIGDRTHIIATRPTPAGPLTLAFDQQSFDLPGALTPPTCQGAILPPGITPAPPTGEGGYAPRAACKSFRVAIEADNEFVTVSGGLQNATDYAVILVAASSLVYNRDVGIGFDLSFLRVWSGPDPWNGSSTGEQLGQLQAYWQNSMPGENRASVHLFSGRPLGGGIAYLSAACSDGSGFAVSANLNGSFPFPVVDNASSNWDLFVVAHEWGHNFGTNHTHNSCSYNPIIDGCGLSSGGGPCESGTKDCAVATARNGTIMSYCHTCSGGVSNVKMAFGPRVSARISQFAAAASCGTTRQPPSLDGIVANPSADTCSRQPITLTAAASGDNLRYQWFKNDVRVPGATGRSHRVEDPAGGDRWDVMVYSPCGAILTQGTPRTVRFSGSRPIITSHPASLTVCPRTQVTFAVQATESPNYQWRKNGVNIPGAIFASYTITAPTLADEGRYDCVVSNSCGSETSRSATLTVTQSEVLWLPSGDQLAGVNGTVHASVMWDPDGADGPQPARLVIGGRFKIAGAFVTNNVAVFDLQSQSWSPLGSGLTGPVTDGLPAGVDALAVRPDGSGRFELIAAGDFTLSGTAPVARIAAWTGTAWAPLGVGVDNTVRALAVLPSGRLVAGGDFTNAGGAAANRVAEWSGSSWLPLGVGLNNTVRALAVLPGGGLVAGGDFAAVGGPQYVAAWNGSAWATLGEGVNDAVRTLKVLASGDLVAGGSFDATPTGLQLNFIARWSQDAWSPIGSGFNGRVFTIDELPDGHLVAGGEFGRTGANLLVNRIARWDGTTWNAVGSGVPSAVLAITSLPDGAFAASGAFDVASGVPVARIARHDGSTWSAMGSGVIGIVSSLLPLPNGELIAAHSVNYAGRTPALRVARWNGVTWLALGGGMNAVVNAVARLPDGQLIAGGDFTAADGVTANRIARWNGAAWSPLSPQFPGLTGAVNALAVLQNGHVLAGGAFLRTTTVTGGPAAVTLNRIGRWDGSQWLPLGTGLNGAVNAILELPNGDVIVGGAFDRASGLVVSNIARWKADGTGWAAVGSGLNSTVRELLLRPDGTIVAGGDFTRSGSVDVRRIASWNGASWSPLGDGLGDLVTPGTSVRALGLLADGRLVAGGSFAASGDVAVSNIAVWDRSAWAPLDPSGSSTPSGVDGEVRDIATLAPPLGDLVVGGAFGTVNGLVSPFISRYGYRQGPPVLLHPQSQVVVNGQTLTLTALPANGFPNVWVQWKRNGVDLVDGPGGASPNGGIVTGARRDLASPTAGSLATLTISQFRAGDVGEYVAVFTNDCGSVFSNVAVVDMQCVAPSIDTQPPSSIQACAGTTFSIAVAATAYPAPSFQWRKGLVPLVDGGRVSGANSARLTIVELAPADAGAYSCVVTNSCSADAAVSAATSLTVRQAPVVDPLPPLVTACLGGQATITVTASGSTPLSFQWRKNGVNMPGRRSSSLSFPAVALADAALYDCVVTNDCGSSISSRTLLQIGTGPQIASLPPSLVACAGQPFDLVVIAQTSGPAFFQWRKNGADIPGATGARFSIANPDADDAGLYDCRVTDACGTALSSSTQLAVSQGTAADITNQPQDLSVCSGFPATFTVVASNALAFQWRKNGIDIPGAQAASYAIEAVASADIGSYDCLVTGACGSVASEVATLEISSQPPVIDVQPASLVVCSGRPATFVIAVSGSPSFQWRKGGTNISGATSASFTIASVTAADAAAYDCLVSTGCADVVSKAALLSVGSVNDLPASASQMFDSIALSGDTSCATVDTSVPVCAGRPVVARGLWYRLGGTGTSVSISLCGSSYDTRLSVFCGTPDSLTCVADNDDACGLASSLSFCTRLGTDYYVLVHGKAAGDAGPFTIVSIETPIPCQPTVACEPVGACCIGSDCIQVTASQCELQGGTFLGPGSPCETSDYRVAFTSASPLPVAIPDRNAATATISVPAGSGSIGELAVRLGLRHAHVGDLTIRLSRGTTSVLLVARSGNAATLDGDYVFADRAPVAFAQAADRVSQVAAGDYKPAAALAAFRGQPFSGLWTVEVRDNADFDVGALTSFALLSASGAPICSSSCAPAITSQPVSDSVCVGESAVFTVVAADATGFQWRRNGSPIAGAVFSTLVFGPVLPGDAADFDCLVSNDCGIVRSNVARLGVAVTPAITSDPLPALVCVGEPVTFTVAAANATGFQWRRNGAPIAGATAASFTIASVGEGDAGQYDCLVSNACGQVVSAAASLTVNPLPSVISGPVPASVCLGEPITFTVAAANATGFQWRRNGAPIAGATAASFTIASVGSGDAGEYDCLVSNACGVVVGGPARLDVDAPPFIVAQPASRAACPGDAVSFTILLAAEPRSIQWRRNGIPIAGATSSVLPIAAVGPTDAGAYDCVVSNDCGIRVSDSATLDVNGGALGNDQRTGAVTLLPGIAVTGDTTCGSIDSDAPVCSAQTVSAPGLWYKLGGQGTAVTVSLCGSRFDTRLSVFCAAGDILSCIAGNDDACERSSSVSFCAQAGADYYVLVHGFQTATGPFTIILTDSQQSCSTTDACSSVGACCIAGTDCVQLSAADCQLAGGSFLGEGTPCQSVAYPDRFVSVEPFPVLIPDLGSASVAIDVPAGAGIIENLAVRAGIEHTFVGDLVVTLTRQDTSVVLVGRPAGGADLVGEYVFADAAPAAFASAAAGVPFVVPSVYRPANPLAAFDGQPFDGRWTLEVRDQAGEDVGRITSLSLLNTSVALACTFCPADFNQDGGVDGADIEAFFFAWEQSDPTADINQDGGVDGSDIEPFFILWQAGGC